jgi:hypothetical protein
MTQFAEAARRSLDHLMKMYPGTITLAGKTTAAAVIKKRGKVVTATGGFKQARSLAVMVPYARFAESDLADATTAVTKRAEITHDDVTYRVHDVSHDPYEVHWMIKATEAVA